LLRASEFRLVYWSGRRLASNNFVAFALPNGRAVSRFGMSLKSSPGERASSVTRNRVRRRVREILRRCRAQIPAGWDIVLHPKAAVGEANFAALEAEILRLFAKGLSTPSSQGNKG
jgi:ribonuclease P protein component